MHVLGHCLRQVRGLPGKYKYALAESRVNPIPRVGSPFEVPLCA